ncbi:cytochrome (ubi)quinol oxidase subunit III [Sphingomonas sp. KRR8]|uniref:cytochrome (ubi)quinol oxidase subunit III n=1 Tax=Sphingomonas sp. KRR8 TaxID=2942996 RepID=UPI0020208C40|nr:cytochrome (ubi)quinol oxidase subunit III [Sphingomonas sp. KRR8]URD62049.1 cytochrome (ubi)quinol oxidase subunit III [Sphingomonas sp. KRR8]
MSAPAAARPRDPYQLGHGHEHGHGHHHATGHGEGGPASKRIITGYGFWIFLLSDFVVFSGFFAAYAVLRDQTAGGPAIHDIVDPARVAWQTALLLLSSFTAGLGSLAAQRKNLLWTELALLVTGLLGFGFLALEFAEFASMVREGMGPNRSAFLSSFFALVGCHGLHVSAGLLWLGTMMAQIWAKGFRADIQRRLLCFNLFWHALDIIWVAIFTMVYLMGLVI